MIKRSNDEAEAPSAVPSPDETEDFGKRPKEQEPKKTFTERPGFFRGAKVRKP